jgi:uncharacterized protein Usg
MNGSKIMSEYLIVLDNQIAPNGFGIKYFPKFWKLNLGMALVSVALCWTMAVLDSQR